MWRFGGITEGTGGENHRFFTFSVAIPDRDQIAFKISPNLCKPLWILEAAWVSGFGTLFIVPKYNIKIETCVMTTLAR